jgi:hypothetical protein
LKDTNSSKQEREKIFLEDLKKKDEELRKRENESVKLILEIENLKKEIEGMNPNEKKIAEIRLQNLSSEEPTVLDKDAQRRSPEVGLTHSTKDEDLPPLRKKKKIQKKRPNVSQPQNGYNFYYPSFVGTTDSNYQKKTGECDDIVIDIEDESTYSSEVVDGPDFFFSKNYCQTMKNLQPTFSASADVEKKIQSTSQARSVEDRKTINHQNSQIDLITASYENQIESLRNQNEELSKKINLYECNSILQLNRNLRSGIPVRFFPCHTKTSYSSICSMD